MTQLLTHTPTNRHWLDVSTQKQPDNNVFHFETPHLGLRWPPPLQQVCRLPLRRLGEKQVVQQLVTNQWDILIWQGVILTHRPHSNNHSLFNNLWFLTRSWLKKQNDKTAAKPQNGWFMHQLDGSCLSERHKVTRISYSRNTMFLRAIPNIHC